MTNEQIRERLETALRWIDAISIEYDAAIRGRDTADPKDEIERAVAWARKVEAELE